RTLIVALAAGVFLADLALNHGARQAVTIGNLAIHRLDNPGGPDLALDDRVAIARVQPEIIVAARIACLRRRRRLGISARRGLYPACRNAAFELVSLFARDDEFGLAVRPFKRGQRPARPCP